MSKIKLTARQKDILGFIKGVIRQEGYPPSLREICARFAIKGPSNARKHLETLEKKGFIRRKQGLARGIEVIDGPQAGAGGGGISIPIAGAVRAGPPALAVEDIVGHVTLDEGFFNCADTFILRVEGQSMIGAGMEEGDHLIVRPGPGADSGDIVVAMLDNEATVKRFFTDGETVTLKPENPSMRPIVITPGETESFSIIGKVIFIMKKVG